MMLQMNSPYETRFLCSRALPRERSCAPDRSPDTYMYINTHIRSYIHTYIHTYIHGDVEVQRERDIQVQRNGERGRRQILQRQGEAKHHHEQRHRRLTSWWLPAKGVIEVGGGHSSDRGDSGEEERGGKQSHHSRQQRRVGASEGRRQPRHFVPQRFFKRVRVRASCFPFEAASPSAQVHNRRPHCCAIQQR